MIPSDPFSPKDLLAGSPTSPSMATLIMQFVAAGFFGRLANRFARLHQMFKRSRVLAPPDGCERASFARETDTGRQRRENLHGESTKLATFENRPMRFAIDSADG